MEKEKKSVIKEAITEFDELMEAASANAKKKLAINFPDEFSNLLKEEINNKNNTKESYIKIDENKESDKDDIESNEETVMKNEKETKKVVKEGDSNQPFEEKPKGGVNVVKEEREKEFMGDVESDTPNKADGKTEKGNTYVDKITTKQDTLANKTTVKEEFDISGLDSNSVDEALENAGDEDEVITMDEIENEIAGMESLEEDLSAGDAGKPKAGSDDGDPYTKLVSMKNQLDEMIESLGEQKNQGGKQNFTGREKGGLTAGMIDEEEEVVEQKNQGGKQNFTGREKGGLTTSMIDEEQEEITDADVMDVLGGAPSEVDENLEHTQTHANARKTGSQNHVNYGKENRLRDAMKEGEDKKIGSLIEENKKLTKSLNETKKYKKAASTLVEQYKSALEKYRNQLKEMATFNTNLAHVNNLLVNEELALTQVDKVNIINEFKTVGSITESQKKYKTMLTEMKSTKKTITENIEDKVTTSVGSSSKQKLDEATEVTAYADNKHLQKMKRIIESIENRGSSKKII